MSRKQQKLILGVILAPVLVAILIFIFLLSERVRGKMALASYRKALAAQGEKTTTAEFATRPDPDLNGAAPLKLAVEGIQDGEVLPDHFPPCMRLVHSGKAAVGFRMKEWTEDGVSYNWTQAAADLATNAFVLEQARAALQKPILDNQLDYEKGAKLLLPHLQNGKGLARWFGASAQLALQKGSTSEATEHLVAQVRLLRAFENDRLLISELVRIAAATIARSYTWEALQARQWDDADLAKLSAAWQEPTFMGAMARALEGERVYISATYDLMRESNEEAVSILYWMEDSNFLMDPENEVGSTWMDSGIVERIAKLFRNELYCRIWRFAWLDQNECRYMHHIQRLVEIARDAALHKSMAVLETQLTAEEEATRPHSLYDTLRMPGQTWTDTLTRSLLRPMRMETERSLLMTAIALKRYHLRENRFPDSLERLVPQFLESLPVDYMDGKSLRYRPNVDGTFLLYSVGDDRADDGGDASILPEKALGNIWNRRDIVWPAEASAQEVQDDAR